MPALLHLTLPNKKFHIYEKDLLKLKNNLSSYEDRISETGEKRFTYYASMSWELYGIITNTKLPYISEDISQELPVKWEEFLNPKQIKQYPYDFYYVNSKSEAKTKDRGVFLSGWEESINPFLLDKFLNKLEEHIYINELTNKFKNLLDELPNIRRLIKFGKKYCIRINITADPD